MSPPTDPTQLMRPAPPPPAIAPSAKSAAPAKNAPPSGLTSDEARSRLTKFGPNAMPDTSVHPLRMALEKFWAPVPWMLEAAVVLELALGKYVEAAIIAGLLVFNAALGLFQESRAQATLAALKSRLALNASVRRDGAWKTMPAAELVPGDVVKLSLGGVVAADVHIANGEVLLDQSMLTGESVPTEAGAGVQTFAGARPVRLSGTENRHKAVQKSHAEVGFLSGLRPPFLTVSGSEKSYRPRKLRWRQISGERWERSSSRTSMPSLLNCWMASCM
jgi:magnesium-transporting ATPase (P-type)